MSYRYHRKARIGGSTRGIFGPHEWATEPTHANPIEPKVRVHRVAWAFPIQWPPRASTPWENSWELRAGGAKSKSMVVDGVRFWMRTQLAKGPDLLTVQLPEMFTAADVVLKAESEAENMALNYAHAWAITYDAKINGVLRRSAQPVEYALAFAGLCQREGKPGLSRWWVDGSPGGGVLELETQDAALALRMVSAWREAEGSAEERTETLLEMLRRMEK